MVKAANLAMKFLLELVAIGALGYWGATAGRGALAVLLGPATFVVIQVATNVYHHRAGLYRIPGARWLALA